MSPAIRPPGQEILADPRPRRRRPLRAPANRRRRPRSGLGARAGPGPAGAREHRPAGRRTGPRSPCCPRSPRYGDETGVDACYFLGLDADGMPYFAVDAPYSPGDGERSATLREIGASLGDREAGLFVHAVGLANWHARHGFCPQCGWPDAGDRGGPRPGVHGVRGAAVPALRPRGDHARDRRRRPHAARPQPRLAARALLDPGGLRRAGGVARAGRRPGGLRGGRRRRRRRPLRGQPAVAVPASR